MRKHFIALIAGLAIEALPAAAVSLNFGGQVTASIPTGPMTGRDWLDGQVGGGVGTHMVVGLEGGHAIVPRFDYTYFKNTGNGIERKVQMYQLGADYDFFLSREVNKGPYLGGGAGFGMTKFELDGRGSSADDTPNAPYVAVQAGWMFTPHLGGELRYTWARYKPDLGGFQPFGYTGKQDVDAPTLNASFIFRF